MATDALRQLVAAAVAGAALQAANAYADQHIAAGLVVVEPTGALHLYMDRALTQQSTVWYQTAKPQGGRHCCHQLRLQDLEMIPGTPDRLLMASSGTPVHYRRLVNPPKDFSDAFIGVAMAASQVKALGRYQLSTADGPVTIAWLCNGTEGVNLLRQTGQRYSALYLGLGYSFNQRPPCTGRDLKAINLAE